jgi:Peptidase family M1 domain
MRLRTRWIVISIIITGSVLLQACQPQRAGSPTAQPASPTAIVLISTPDNPSNPTPLPTSPPASQTPAPTTHPYQRPKYILQATINYSLHHVAIKEQIEYTNNASDTLAEIPLATDPMYYPGTFQLNSIALNSGQPATDYREEEGAIYLPLSAPLAPGGQVEISIDYELNLPSPTPSADTRPVPFGYTARQANLVDWYPFIPPYVNGQGWLLHKAGFYGEHLVYEDSDFQVKIQIEDADPKLVIAASAADQPDGGWHHFQIDSARNFTWSISNEYQVLTQTVGDVTIYGYAFPYHAEAGKMALKTTAQALELYSQLFGPYPHKTMSVVEADFLDGMEYDGLYFLSYGFYNLYKGTPGEYLVDIAAHETAHQWWYGLVGSDQALEPWLDEAMATYTERIFYERVYPQYLDWWWAYRVNYYQPQGWVDGTIYNTGGYRPYRDAIYLNGALFLEALRKQIGDEAFFAFLKDYATQYAQQIATGSDFFNLLKKHTNQDLTSLKSQYFQSR